MPHPDMDGNATREGVASAPARLLAFALTLRRKAGRFLHQPAFVQLWFVPIWIVLGFSKLAILIVSFRRLAPRLGRRSAAGPWLPLLDPGRQQRALMIGRAVRLAARYTPWDSNCFPQAVTARLLLGLYRIPYALFFGVARDTRSQHIEAHAWVAAGKVRVTGGPGFDRFTVVGCFAAPWLPAA